MTRFVTAISSSAKVTRLAFAGAASLMMAAPTLAQDQPEVVRGQEPDVQDVVMTPVDDLNINSGEIPAILIAASNNPYASLNTTDCSTISLAIADLDAVLGPDYDLVEEDIDPLSEGKIAKRVVGSFIPFRGILREVTGAAADKRELEAAIMAGLTRRGYLKGLGEASGCPYPARPAFVAIDIDEDDVVEMQPVSQQ